MLDSKFREMQELVRGLGSVVVAFSGGVDSAFVLKVCLDELGFRRVLAVTGRSDSVARNELTQASTLAVSLGVEHVVLDTDEFQKPQYVANAPDRCYHCKTSLYTHLQLLALERGMQHMVNGTNADDLGDHRPGLRAAAEFGVIAPAADAGLTKIEIRELSARLGLPTHDKPASPCLSSRIPYGTTVTPAKLRMIEEAEGYLHALGFRVCRVRHFGESARIEVPVEELGRIGEPTIWADILDRFRKLGFRAANLDPRGFRSGSLNELVPLKLGGPIGGEARSSGRPPEVASGVSRPALRR